MSFEKKSLKGVRWRWKSRNDKTKISKMVTVNEIQGKNEGADLTRREICLSFNRKEASNCMQI